METNFIGCTNGCLRLDGDIEQSRQIVAWVLTIPLKKNLWFLGTKVSFFPPRSPRKVIKSLCNSAGFDVLSDKLMSFR